MLAGLAATIVLALAGCGAKDFPFQQGNAPAPDIDATPSATPSRVVALGQGPDADTLIASGIVPVGMTDSINEVLKIANTIASV